MGDQPQVQKAPASPAGPRGRTPGCRAPSCFSRSLLSASWDLGVPRHPGARNQGPPQSFPAVVARVPRCPTPRPGSAFFPSSCGAEGPGPRLGPRVAPPGLRGQKPESRRRTPSPLGFHPGATSARQRRAPAQPALRGLLRAPSPPPESPRPRSPPRPAPGELGPSALQC